MSEESSAFPDVSYDQWRARVEQQLGESVDLDEVLTSEVEGVRLEPLYTATHPDDLRDLRPSVPISHARAGEWWTVQPHSRGDSLQRLRLAIETDLDNGVDGIRLSLERVAEYREMLAGRTNGWRVWCLDQETAGLGHAAVCTAWLESAGLARDRRRVAFGLDPVARLARHGAAQGPIEILEEDLARLVRYSDERLPEVRALGVSSGVFREAGAEADQELGIALAVAVHQLRAMERHGLAPEIVAAEIAFDTAVGPRLFLEIAKLRALRDLWSRLLNSCGVVSPDGRSWIHARVLGRSLGRDEPWRNLLRITAAGSAAVLGGADSVETSGWDAGGTERSSRLARNVQHILRQEAYLGKVVDPAAGSYAIERSTRALVERGWKHFQEIERRGGIIEVLASDWLQQEIADRWERGRAGLETSRLARRAEAATRGGATSPEAAPSAAEDAGSPAEAAVADALPPHAAVEPPSENRWSWALERAREGWSALQIDRALYPAPSVTICSPLPRLRDENGWMPEGGMPR